MTASFMKELMRRSVLEAAVDGVDPDDTHLRSALDGLLHAQEELTRVLLGDARGRGPLDGPPGPGSPAPEGPTGWEESGGCADPFA